MQLDGQKDVSLPKIENYISQLNIEFDNNAINRLHEICKCELIDGVNPSSAEDDGNFEPSKSNLKNTISNIQSGVSHPSNPNKHTSSNKMDENEDLLAEMSFSGMDGSSPNLKGQNKKLSALLSE